jgi:hypothetical protein
MDYKPLHFIGDHIEVDFNKQPLFSKKPYCPDRFIWKEQVFHITDVLGEWQDYSRKGRMALNMRPTNAAKAIRQGSWGVGRFYFRVQTENIQIFDLYYDRAPKDVDDRKGSWFLLRELERIED